MREWEDMYPAQVLSHPPIYPATNLRAVLVPGALHADSLALGEVGAARTIGHEVVDGILARAVGAGVLTGSAGPALLAGGSIGNHVAVAVALAFKGVQKTHPVADLVGGGGARRSRCGKHVAAIAEEGIRVGRHVGRVVAVSVEALEIFLEVEVERLVVALAELLLHGEVVAVGCPLRVDGPVGALEGELEASVLVAVVKDLELGIDSGGL